MLHDEHILTKITGVSKLVPKVAIGMGKESMPWSSIEVGVLKNCDTRIGIT